MIFNGSAASEESKGKLPQTQAVLAISQLLVFNRRKLTKKIPLMRHKTDRETLLSVYLRLKYTQKHGKRRLVNMLHNLGLGISCEL